MPTDLHITTMGQGERLVFVHGSGGWGDESFAEQRALASQFRVELVDRRGFGDSPSTGRVDWESDARDLEELLDLPAHLIGHSYGAIACLLCAARVPAKVQSLTLIEPSTYAVARGHPAVEALFARMQSVYAAAPRMSPAEYFFAVAAAFGFLDSPTPHPIELVGKALAATIATMGERPPWDAEIPLEMIAASRIPTLLVMGAWDTAPDSARSILGAALGAVADVVESRLQATRVVIPGAHHWPQRSGRVFNEALTTFLGSVGTP